MQKMMQRMGIQQEEIDADEVIIRCKDKDLIISNPQVAKVNMMGQESLQITGDIEERARITEDDIKTIMDQANCSREEAKKALEKNNYDLAAAIISLKEE